MNPSNTPSVPDVEQINGWLDDVFTQIEINGELDEREKYENAAFAFCELVGFFFYQSLCESKPEVLHKCGPLVHIDEVGLAAMLKYFQRDVYGVKNFSVLAERMVKEQLLQAGAKEQICEAVRHLGLRITSGEPRKTRVAAAFSLWMCVFRPVSFSSEMITYFPSPSLEHFCAGLNYWMASSFLEKFGVVDLGKQCEAEIRHRRILHDFTVRGLNLSSLEFFYAGIFREAEKPNCKQ